MPPLRGHRMLSRRRRLAIAAVMGFALLAGGLYAARATVLRAALDAVLARSGILEVEYRVAGVGLNAIHLADIQLGRELSVAHLIVHFHPWALARFDVDEIVVSGLRLDLSQADRAPPAFLARLRDAEDRTPAAPPDAPPALPRLRIDDAVIRLADARSLAIEHASWVPAADLRPIALTAARLAIAFEGAPVVLRDVVARIEPDWRKADAHVASVHVASIEDSATEPRFAALTLDGTVRRRQGSWDWEGLLALPRPSGADGAHLKLLASFDWRTGNAQGEATLAPTRLRPGGLQPGDIVPLFAEQLANASGLVAMDLAWRWRGGRASVTGGARIEDGAARLGGLAVSDLHLKLGLKAAQGPQTVAVHIEQARAAALGGTFVVAPTVLHPLGDGNRLVIAAEGLDLGQILDLVSIDGVAGEGRVGGRLPLDFGGDLPAIDHATLAAQGPGVLRIASPEAAAALAQGGDHTNLMLEALADFRFESLALTVDHPATGESRLTLATRGHNPAVLDGHPFQINVTVASDLDKLIAALAQGERLSAAIIRAIVGKR